MDVDDKAQLAQFRSEVDRLISKSPHGLIRGCFVVELAATEQQWTKTEIELSPGDWVTTLAVGRTCRSCAQDIRAPARAQVCMRVGHEGTILRSTRNTHSFLAFESGPLYLASGVLGEGADQTELRDACGRVSGHLSIGVLLWNGPTLKGLKQIARLGELSALIEAEIDRIRNVE